jgi:hypothetical protein
LEIRTCKFTTIYNNNDIFQVTQQEITQPKMTVYIISPSSWISSGLAYSMEISIHRKGNYPRFCHLGVLGPSVLIGSTWLGSNFDGRTNVVHGM